MKEKKERDQEIIFVGFFAVSTFLLVLYQNSFFSRFFQDDFELLAKAKVEYFLAPVPQFHYHLISNQLFYFISKNIFGPNVVGFHLVLFLAFVLSLYFLFQIALLLFRSPRKALLTVIFFAFNISFFAFFYWVAVSYFIFGTLFFLMTIYFYLKRNRWLFFSFVAAILSNEINFVLPAVLIILSWYNHSWSKYLGVILSIDFVYILIKIFLIGFSPEPVYKLTLNFQAFSTFRWYLLRALNLPEGIKNGENTLIFATFFLLLVLLGYCLWKSCRTRNIVRDFYMLASWFVVGSFPFYFLPKHMSAYYLSLSLPAVSLFYSKILSINKVTLLISLILYLILTFNGLNFLSNTHWTILKLTP